MAFRLAANNGTTVKKLLEEIDSHELSEWIAAQKYFHILPDTYWQAAMIACTIANCHRDPKRKAYEVNDFMPREPVKQQSIEQIRDHLDSLLGQIF